jgi:hypothetical protein
MYNAVNTYLVMRGVRPGFFPEVGETFRVPGDQHATDQLRMRAKYSLISHCLDDRFGRPGVIRIPIIFETGDIAARTIFGGIGKWQNGMI